MPEKCPDIPDEIWEQIISKFDQDRFLVPLSMLSRRFLSLTNQAKQTLSISDPTARLLPRLLRRFPNLKHISLSDFHGDPDSILLLIAQFRFPLESLDLSNLKRLPVEGIRGLPVSSLRSIKSLKLRCLSVLSDWDLGFIAQWMPNLEELDLSEPKDDYRGDADDMAASVITDDGVESLASKLSSLRRIRLSGNYLISDKSLDSLPEKCDKLEEIVVDKCNFVTQDGISNVLRKCVNLKSVSFLGMDIIAPDISDSLACARNVSVLDFSYMRVSDGLLFAIVKACLPLKKFTLFHCENFTFSGILALLRTYQSLEYLALEGVYFLNDRSMIDLSKFLRNANTVKLNFCSRLSDSTFFTLVKNCPSMNSLEMEKTNLGKQEFAVNNVSNPRLRALNLASNKTLTNECLDQIAAACPNIQVLDVSNCLAISRKGVGDILRKCNELRHLQISGCGQVKNLGVNVDVPKLEVLRASGSGLTDEGMAMVGKRCEGLMYLDVTCCNSITSRGVLEVVGSCSKLREINLNFCRITDKSIVPRMVLTAKSLRKIVTPRGLVCTEDEKNFFWEHGCYVCEG
ncbi:hypothetical protein Dimus_004444 [Dionaea muscipula]